MKRRSFLIMLLGGIFITIFAFIPSTQTYAQNCGGQQQPPCPPPVEEEKEKPTKTPFPTFTPTVTETPLPTETPAACISSKWFPDADFDNYGIDSGIPVLACIQPVGYAAGVMDCNDANWSINPGAADVCGDGIDQDCNGSDAACSSAASAPIAVFCFGSGCETDIPSGRISPWLFGSALTLLGILIGLLLPFILRSFFGLRPNAALSAQTVHKPGDEVSAINPGPPHTPGGMDGTVNPGPPSTPGGLDGGVTPGPPNTPGGMDGTVSPGPPSTPGGMDGGVQPGPPNTPGGMDGTVSPGPPNIREAALNAREAELNVRDAALKIREAALRGSGTGE